MNKILIVEDEPDMVTGLRDNFELEGYKVIVALAGDFLVALYRCERCPATGQSPTEILYLFRVAAAHLQFCCRLMRQTAEMKNYEQNSNSRRRTGYGDGLAR